MSKNSEPEKLDSPDRRAALSAIRKYATLGAGASVVVLSSTDAVKAMASSQGITSSDDDASI